MAQFGKTMVLFGIGLAVLGVFVWVLGSAFPGLKPGRLPGDIAVEGEGGSFYFPITTMILASVVITVVFWLIGMVRR